MALTIFAFNNTPQQFAIREAGGIKYSVFEQFMHTPDEFHQCYAAFQVIARSSTYSGCVHAGFKTAQHKRPVKFVSSATEQLLTPAEELCLLCRVSGDFHWGLFSKPITD